MGRKMMNNIKTFSVNLDKGDYEKIYKVAQQEQTSISQILRRLIREYLQGI